MGNKFDVSRSAVIRTLSTVSWHKLSDETLGEILGALIGDVTHYNCYVHNDGGDLDNDLVDNLDDHELEHMDFYSFECPNYRKR